MPAVIAAPMTSSLVRPAGISWAVTCSSGCSAFQASTMAVPHSTSNALFESQMVMSPRDVVALLAPALPLATVAPQAAAVSPKTAIAAVVLVYLIVSPLKVSRSLMQFVVVA